MNTRFSSCRRYRYSLRRDLSPMFPGDEAVMFVCLNPSTANEHLNDPTIRRCMGFAQRWGYGTLFVTNLSPLRATDPSELKAAGPEPEDVAEENRQALAEGAMAAGRIVAAWGTHGVWGGRDRAALQALGPWVHKLYCLRLTKDGHPQHPLYVAANQEVMRFP